MNLRIMDLNGKMLGMLQLPPTVLIADLESLRRLGAHRIELVSARLHLSGL